MMTYGLSETMGDGRLGVATRRLGDSDRHLGDILVDIIFILSILLSR